MNWDILKKYNVVEYKSPEQEQFYTQIVVTKELKGRRTVQCVFYRNR